MMRYGHYFYCDKGFAIDLTTMEIISSFQAPTLPDYQTNNILEILESAESENLQALSNTVRSRESIRYHTVDGITDGVVVYFAIDDTTYLLECDETLKLQKAIAFSVGEWSIVDIQLFNDGYDWYRETN